MYSTINKDRNSQDETSQVLGMCSASQNMYLLNVTILWLTQCIADQILVSQLQPAYSHQMSASLVATTTSNNNNNIHDNVYGAVIMTKVIARVHPVHLM